MRGKKRPFAPDSPPRPRKPTLPPDWWVSCWAEPIQIGGSNTPIMQPAWMTVMQLCLANGWGLRIPGLPYIPGKWG